MPRSNYRRSPRFLGVGTASDGGLAHLSRIELEAAAISDLVLSSGGVSMGDYDLVKRILAETGDIDFWKVAMKPAKPFAFGRIAGKPFFGLPGNPVSVAVAFEQFLRPALLHMMGARLLFRPRIRGIIEQDVRTDPQKVVFLRVNATAGPDGVLRARLSGGQGSNILSALAAADAYAVIPVGDAEVPAGSLVDLEMMRMPAGRSWEEAQLD